MVFQHTDHFRRESRADRAVARHLALLKDALLDRHYLENELRLSLLTAEGRPPAAGRGRAPRSGPRRSRSSTASSSASGSRPPGPTTPPPRRSCPTPRPARPSSTTWRHRSTPCVGTAWRETSWSAAPGRGGGAIFMRAYLDAHEVAGDQGVGGGPVPLQPRARGGAVAARPGGPGLPGRPQHGARRLRPVRRARRPGALRPGLRRGAGGRRSGAHRPAAGRAVGGRGRRAGSSICSTTAWPTGGAIVVDCGVRTSHRSRVEKFRADRGITTPLQPVDGSAVAWRKARDEATAPALAPAVSGDRAHPVLAPPLRGRSRGPVGGGRLLQHAARGPPHPALALTAPTRRASRGRATRSSSWRTAPPTISGSDRRSWPTSGPSSATSTSAPTPRRRRWAPSTGGSRRAGGGTWPS